MAKTTLYITFDGLSDPLGQSQILPYITGVAANGYRITIISCEKQERLKTEKSRIESLLSKNSIDWKHIDYDQDGGFFSRFSYLKQLLKIAEKENAEKKFSLVHCRSYLASWIGLKLKRKYNIPFLFDMRGFWADERIEGNIWSRKNLLHMMAYRYFKRKEKEFLKYSDAIVSLTHAAEDMLEKKFPEFNIKSKTNIIPCCVNTDLFNGNSVNKTGNDHLLIYAGSVGTWYYTKEMIDCVLVMRELIPDIKLLIVTRDREALNTILQNYSESDQKIISTESASYSDMPSVLSRARASIFFIKPAFSKMASSPTKMAECWAMNLPIITNSGIGDNDIYFNTHKGGVLVNDFTPEAYRKAAKDYLASLNTNVNYRQIAVQYFNTKNAVATYTSIYQRHSR
ncbi:MAG: glycosyltransferase [Bacteroidetes bacterium]|nr:glycosyltransferase [Bacteroidota bacterium]